MAKETSEAEVQAEQVEAEVTSPEKPEEAVPEVEAKAAPETPEVKVQEAEEPKFTQEEWLGQIAAKSEEERKELLKHGAFQPLVQGEVDVGRDAQRRATEAQLEAQLAQGQQIATTAKSWDDLSEDQRVAALRSIVFNAQGQGALQVVNALDEAFGRKNWITMTDEEKRVLGAQIGNAPNASVEYFLRAMDGNLMSRRESQQQIKDEVDAQLEAKLASTRKAEPKHPAMGPSEPVEEEAELDKILADPKATGEQKADAFEKRYGYRPRNI